MATVALGLLCVVGLATAAPAKTYDQRQHGELNIHAQLDNIVIVLIPSSKINLMDVSPDAENNLTQVKPDKNAFLEFLQNHIKNDIDRYDVQPPTTHEENEVLTSQNLNLSHEEKEEEVVATVEEMKPEKDSAEKTTVPTKTEATEDTTIKEHSTVSESVQETTFKISIPVELKDAVKKAEDKVKTSDKEIKKEEKETHKISEKVEKVSNDAVKPPVVKDLILTKKEQPQEKKEDMLRTKVEHGNKETLKVSSGSGSALDALIKPVAARKSDTSPESAVSGVRREKVIRYKPEAKWAPGLVDVLAPARQERQRFASVCATGLWDSELKTCIMPGETRRNELARFLEAMRFGIALPAQ